MILTFVSITAHGKHAIRLSQENPAVENQEKYDDRLRIAVSKAADDDDEYTCAKREIGLARPDPILSQNQE